MLVRSGTLPRCSSNNYNPLRITSFLCREYTASPETLSSECEDDYVGLVRTIVGGTALWWLSSLVLALIAGPLLVVVPLLIGVQVIRGVAIPVYSINQITVRQAMLPSRLLGRVNATRRFLVFGIIPIGSLIGGALGQAAGLRQALLVGALVQGLSLLWLVLSPIRRLREAPGLSGASVEAC